MDQFFGPPGLTKAQVLEKIRNSRGSQWICYPDAGMLAFKGDLLIRMEATRHSPRAFTVRYGALAVCEVEIEAEFSHSHADSLSSVTITGGLNHQLTDVEVVYEHPADQYSQPIPTSANYGLHAHAAFYAD
jgi:hypothetical protein